MALESWVGPGLVSLHDLSCPGVIHRPSCHARPFGGGPRQFQDLRMGTSLGPGRIRLYQSEVRLKLLERNLSEISNVGAVGCNYGALRL